jgi:hypothetical protein
MAVNGRCEAAAGGRPIWPQSQQQNARACRTPAPAVTETLARRRTPRTENVLPIPTQWAAAIRARLRMATDEGRQPPPARITHA